MIKIKKENKKTWPKEIEENKGTSKVNSGQKLDKWNDYLIKFIEDLDNFINTVKINIKYFKMI